MIWIRGFPTSSVGCCEAHTCTGVWPRSKMSKVRCRVLCDTGDTTAPAPPPFLFLCTPQTSVVQLRADLSQHIDSRFGAFECVSIAEPADLKDTTASFLLDDAFTVGELQANNALNLVARLRETGQQKRRKLNSSTQSVLDSTPAAASRSSHVTSSTATTFQSIASPPSVPIVPKPAAIEPEQASLVVQEAAADFDIDMPAVDEPSNVDVNPDDAMHGVESSANAVSEPAPATEVASKPTVETTATVAGDAVDPLPTKSRRGRKRKELHETKAAERPVGDPVAAHQPIAAAVVDGDGLPVCDHVFLVRANKQKDASVTASPSGSGAQFWRAVRWLTVCEFVWGQREFAANVAKCSKIKIVSGTEAEAQILFNQRVSQKKINSYAPAEDPAPPGRFMGTIPHSSSGAQETAKGNFELQFPKSATKKSKPKTPSKPAESPIKNIVVAAVAETASSVSSPRRSVLGTLGSAASATPPRVRPIALNDDEMIVVNPVPTATPTTQFVRPSRPASAKRSLGLAATTVIATEPEKPLPSVPEIELPTTEAAAVSGAESQPVSPARSNSRSKRAKRGNAKRKMEQSSSDKHDHSEEEDTTKSGKNSEAGAVADSAPTRRSTRVRKQATPLMPMINTDHHSDSDATVSDSHAKESGVLNKLQTSKQLSARSERKRARKAEAKRLAKEEKRKRREERRASRGDQSAEKSSDDDSDATASNLPSPTKLHTIQSTEPAATVAAAEPVIQSRETESEVPATQSSIEEVPTQPNPVEQVEISSQSQTSFQMPPTNNNSQTVTDVSLTQSPILTATQPLESAVAAEQTVASTVDQSKEPEGEPLPSPPPVMGSPGFQIPRVKPSAVQLTTLLSANKRASPVQVPKQRIASLLRASIPFTVENVSTAIKAPKLSIDTRTPSTLLPQQKVLMQAFAPTNIPAQSPAATMLNLNSGTKTRSLSLSQSKPRSIPLAGQRSGNTSSSSSSDDDDDHAETEAGPAESGNIENSHAHNVWSQPTQMSLPPQNWSQMTQTTNATDDSSDDEHISVVATAAVKAAELQVDSEPNSPAIVPTPHNASSVSLHQFRRSLETAKPQTAAERAASAARVGVHQMMHELATEGRTNLFVEPATKPTSPLSFQPLITPRGASGHAFGSVKRVTVGAFSSVKTTVPAVRLASQTPTGNSSDSDSESSDSDSDAKTGKKAKLAIAVPQKALTAPVVRVNSQSTLFDDDMAELAPLSQTTPTISRIRM